MIKIIVAVDKKRVIGKSGDLPWHIPADMKFFRDTTTNNVVIMGHNTFKSIGKALSNRTNIVITSKDFYQDENNLYFRNSYEQAVDLAIEIASKKFCDIYVIGGESVYRKAIADSRLSEILLTLINHEFDGDKHFPLISNEDWELSSHSRFKPEKNDNNNRYGLAFLSYKRRKNNSIKQDIFYYPSSRSIEQTTKMQNIESFDICPFCPEWLEWFHDSPIDTDFEFEHWSVTPNDNPYEGSKLDLLVISNHHTIEFGELTTEAQAEFGSAISKIAEKYSLYNYAVGMRVGPASMVGGSVNHLHAHIKVGDVDDPNHRSIKFKMSNKPELNKPPENY